MSLLSQGAWSEAWRQQPLVVGLAGGAALYIAYALLGATRRWRRPRIEGLPGGAGPWLMMMLLLLAALNWLYLFRAGR